MKLAELELLALRLVEDDTGGTSEREGDLARALIAVLPVARAAANMRACLEPDPDNEPYKVDADLSRAVDAMAEIATHDRPHKWTRNS
jgi:hypothetical protein